MKWLAAALLLVLAQPAVAASIWTGILGDGAGSDRFCYVGASPSARIGWGFDVAYGDDSGGDLGKSCNGSRMRSGTIDGCTWQSWSDLVGDEYCFDTLEVEVDEFDPDAYVVMVAFKCGEVMDYADVVTGMNTLRGRIDAMYPTTSTRGTDALFVISGMPRWDGGSCMAVAGCEAETILASWDRVRTLVADTTQPAGRVILGPSFSAMGAWNTTDGCHQDSDTRAEHAATLFDYLNREMAVAW